ncbi:MAG TPA: hypothetical protein VGL61_25940 [Kofleriaceae bacterium]|jgi:hypothetical protein
MAVLTERKKWKREPSEFAKLRASRQKLTETEQANVRRACTVLGRRYGSFKRLCEAMGMSVYGLMKARTPKRGQSPKLALAVSRVAGCSVDDVLTGKWPPPIVCPCCNGIGYVPA